MEFLFIIGPATLSLVVAQFCKKQNSFSNLVTIIINLIVYAYLNTTTIILFLYPLDKIDFFSSQGTQHIAIGATAYIIVIPIAIAWALISVAIQTRFNVSIEVINVKEKKHEDK